MSRECQNKALKNRQKLLLGSALTCAFAGPVTSLAAETAAAISPMDTVSVVATKSPHLTFDLPAMVTVVDVDEPAVAGASRIKDVLADVPGVEFSGSARRNGQNITLRGYGTEGIVILLDGVRQKFEAGHYGKFFVDPALLKRVEVVRGPSSTLYGGGGLGGVIAFETVSASDLLAPGENSGAALSVGSQSVNDEWMASATGFMRNERMDALASIVSRQSDDIELGDGSSLASDDEIVSGLFKLAYSLTPQSTLKASLQHYQNDSGEPNNPQSASSIDLYDKTTTATTVSLSYIYDNPANELLALTSRVYYTDTEVEERQKNSSRDLSRQLDNLGFSLENSSRFGAGSELSQIFNYGFEFYSENQDGRDNTGLQGEAGGIPDAETDYWGVFIQDEIRLVGVAGLPGEFLIIPGLRFDNYSIENAGGLSLDEDEVSPKLALSYAPQDWLMLFASYAHGFRAPNMTETFATGIHFSIPGQGSNIFVPNPGLKPETNDTFEYGFGLQFRDLLSVDDSLRFKFSRFDTDADDFIDLEVDFSFVPVCCGTSRSVNVSQAELWGYEFEGAYDSRRWRFSLTYADVDGKNKETREYLTNITPATVTANIQLKVPEWGSTMGWRATFADDHDEVNAVSEERDSYQVHDLYYQWGSRGANQLSINCGVDNIFDESYERVFAGSLEPGRNYRLQVNYQW